VTGAFIAYDSAQPSAGCTLSATVGILPADFDADGDVDQRDFGVFQRCYSGPNRAPRWDCAN
jgi:hypothetical protein